MNFRELLVSALFAVIGTVTSAAESITADPLDLPKGGEAQLVVRFQFNEEHDYVSYQFTVTLPENVSLKTDEYGKVPIVLGDGQPSVLFTADLNATSHILTCYSNPSTVIDGTEGVLVRIPLLANESVEIGDKLYGSLTGVEFATIGAVATPFANASVELNIVENRVVLDETSTTPPADAEGVNVRVIRSIKAGDWSTICLPFAMSEAQCKAAFGDDVELANFSSWSSEEDGDGDIISLEIGFTDVTAIEANHPYIIKVSEDVSEFNVDGVDINAEEEPYVKVGKTKATRGYFTGTYIANTTVPENNLFLSGNHFWYSAGTTKMKAFRGYFELADVLTEVEEAGARIAISIDEDPTGIISINKSQKDSNVYFDLMGRRTENPRKGNVYIVDGKKVYFE